MSEATKKTENRENRTKYSLEEKISIARQVLEEGAVQEELVRQTGIPRTCIHTWVRQARRGELTGYTAGPSVASKSLDMPAEIRRLERELSEVRMERDFLKKVAGYFAKGRR